MFIQSDYGPIKINYDPSKYKTAKAAATALYKVLSKLCESWGQTPAIEMALWNPEEADKRGYGKAWMVCWESGPYQWAVSGNFSSRNILAKPYYSFCLSFYEE